MCVRMSFTGYRNKNGKHTHQLCLFVRWHGKQNQPKQAKNRNGQVLSELFFKQKAKRKKYIYKYQCMRDRKRDREMREQKE